VIPAGRLASAGKTNAETAAFGKNKRRNGGVWKKQTPKRRRLEKTNARHAGRFRFQCAPRGRFPGAAVI